MIRRILAGEALELPKNGVEAQKIRALWMAYSSRYDFCRFYTSENTVICIQDGDAVLCVTGEENCDFDELAEFFIFCGVRKIFCSEDAGNRLGKLIGCKLQLVNLMRFAGEPVSVEIEASPPLQEVFGVIQQAFLLPDAAYEPWYLDMSHKIRHGVSKAYRLGGSVAIVQYHQNGEVLLSQVATLPAERGKGNAAKLIKAVCAEYVGSDVRIICSDELIPFYRKIGFVEESKKCNLFPEM